VLSNAAKLARTSIVNELADRFVLNHPSQGGCLRIYTDASNVAIGGVLVEYPEGTDMDPMIDGPTPDGKVLAFCSKVLTPTERRYAVSDRELLAIVFAVERFQSYLSGSFQVVTDHQALEWFKTIQSSRNTRLQRYAMFLSEFSMEHLYRKGSLNVVADALSRLVVQHQPLMTYSPLLNSLLYSQPDVAPTVPSPVVSGKVAVRLSEEAWLRSKLKREVLTNADRFGIIEMVYQNGSVYVRWANGQKFSVGLKRLQHVPLPDYLAALALPVDCLVSPTVPLVEMVVLSQSGDPMLKELLVLATLPLSRQKMVLDFWAIPSSSHVLVRDGLVFYISDPDQIDSARLCIPADLRQMYLKLAHDSVLIGGHRSALLSLASLTPVVYWPFMRSDMEEYVRTCHFCQTHAIRRNPWELPTGYLDVYYPLQRLSLDHIGPVSKTPAGLTHILVVIDHFTKFVWLFPCTEPTADQTARLLFESIFYGISTEVLTDGASALVAKAMQRLYELLNIASLHSTAYHPQGHSVVERVNRTIQEMVGKSVNQLGVRWDEVMCSVTLAYNQTVHRSTGYSPFFLMYGRQVSTPLDILLRKPTVNPGGLEISAIEQYLIRVLDALQASHVAVRESLLVKDASIEARNVELLAKRRESLIFEVGDLVLWSDLMPVDAGTKSTFKPRQLGPFKVISRYGAGCYKIEMMAARGQYRVASALQLSRYHSRHDHFLPDMVASDDPALLVDQTVSSVSVDPVVPVINLLSLNSASVVYESAVIEW
jgi:transposase InsO family protein